METLETIPLAAPRPGGSDAASAPASPAPLLLLAGGSLCFYAALAATGQAGAAGWMSLVLWGGLAVLYSVAAWIRRKAAGERWWTWLVLGAAVAFRLVMLAPAALPGAEVNRWAWDGRVQIAGVNPYLHTPDDPALESLRREDHEAIPGRRLLSGSPPLAQVLAAACAVAGPGSRVLRGAIVAFDLGIIALLWFWLRSSGRHRAEIVLYAWHPLAVFEGAGRGRPEIAGAFLLCLAVVWSLRNRKFPASAALAGAILTRMTPLASLPVFLRGFKFRHMAFLAAVVIVVTGPYLAGAGPGMLGSIRDHAAGREFNGSLHALVRWGIERASPQRPLSDAIDAARTTLRPTVGFEPLKLWTAPQALSLAIAGAAFLAIVGMILRRGLPTDREVMLCLCALLLFSPAVFTWSLVWLLPFLAHWPSRAWLWLSLAVPLAGVAPGAGWTEPPLWVRLAEYTPMAAFWSHDAWLARKQRRERKGHDPA